MTETETEHLIHQADHEIGISRDQKITVDVESPGAYAVTFKNRKGEETKIRVAMDSPFKRVHDLLKAAWKAKA